MYFTFIVVVILTAVALVVAAMTIAHLVAPRYRTPRKESLMSVVFLRVVVHGCSLALDIIFLPFCF